jgi:hypothetical protein
VSVDIAANPPFEGVPEEEKVEDKPVKAVDIVDAFILQVRVISSQTMDINAAFIDGKASTLLVLDLAS